MNRFLTLLRVSTVRMSRSRLFHAPEAAILYRIPVCRIVHVHLNLSVTSGLLRPCNVCCCGTRRHITASSLKEDKRIEMAIREL